MNRKLEGKIKKAEGEKARLEERKASALDRARAARADSLARIDEKRKSEEAKYSERISSVTAEYDALIKEADDHLKSLAELKKKYDRLEAAMESLDENIQEA